MPTVFEDVTDATGQPMPGVMVTIQLIAGEFGAYTAAGSRLLSVVRPVTDAAGRWTAPLVANALVNPADTYYRVVYSDRVTASFVVPDAAGPFRLLDILAQTPTSTGYLVTRGLPGATPVLAFTASALTPGSTPTVTVTGTAEAPRVALGIPRGQTGDPGPTPTLTVTASALAPGAAPTVTVTGTAAAPRIALGIPRGDTGPTGAFTGSETLVDLGNVTGAKTVDTSTASAFRAVLTGDAVLTLTGATAGRVAYATFRLTQDASATPRALTVVGAVGSFGSRVLLSTTPGAVDKVACESWDGGTSWDVALVGQTLS